MESTKMNDLAARLAQARKAAGMTQQELAKKAGCSQGLLANIESRMQKSSSFVPQIAEALGVSAVWLAKGKGPQHLDQAQKVSDLIGQLSEREIKLILGFRAMGEEGQKLLLYQAQRTLETNN